MFAIPFTYLGYQDQSPAACLWDWPLIWLQIYRGHSLSCVCALAVGIPLGWNHSSWLFCLGFTLVNWQNWACELVLRQSNSSWAIYVFVVWYSSMLALLSSVWGTGKGYQPQKARKHLFPFTRAHISECSGQDSMLTWRLEALCALENTDKYDGMYLLSPSLLLSFLVSGVFYVLVCWDKIFILHLPVSFCYQDVKHKGHLLKHQNSEEGVHPYFFILIHNQKYLNI